MRKLFISLLAFVFLLATTQVAGAVPPKTTERPEEEPESHKPPDFIHPIEGETTISGSVYDQMQNALQGVKVKLFIDGLMAAVATTDPGGTYSLKYPIDIGKDKTVMLWYVAPGTQWVPKGVVLHESRAAVVAYLIAKCIPRVQVKPFLEFNVQMVDVPTRSKQIAQSDCLLKGVSSD